MLFTDWRRCTTHPLVFNYFTKMSGALKVIECHSDIHGCPAIILIISVLNLTRLISHLTENYMCRF